MKAHQIHLVDVFAEQPLAGNQLAVVLDAQDIDPRVMQRIAKEMNISETTFVMPPEDAAHAAKIRIFTPSVELPFAGHPIIGTSWVLYSQGLVPGGASEFTLESGAGPVTVRGVRGEAGISFWMTNPKLSLGEIISHRGEIVSAIGLTEAELLPQVPIQVATTGNPMVFAALRDPRVVDSAVADAGRLAEVFHGRAPLPVLIYALYGANRLYCRMFAGHVFGIAEDPASGSGAGPLGAIAVKYGLVARSPRVEIVSEQGTKMGRQSFLHIDLAYADDGDIPSRIDVGGYVSPVLVGTLSDFAG